MKRVEVFVLFLIAISALFFAIKLLNSIGEKSQDVEIYHLQNFASFNQNIIKMIEEGELDEGGEKDIIFTKSSILYMRAEQWQWYPDLEVIANKNYVLHIASQDIQHSFYLEKAATGRAIDILIQPGKEYHILLQGLKPGVYSIGCNEYCGIGHNKMRGKLVVRY